MSPLWILLIGMVVVVGGVLALRLHAFLALILGAIVVAILTPSQYRQRHALQDPDKRYQLVSTEGTALTLRAEKLNPVVGTRLIVLRLNDTGAPVRVGTLEVDGVRERTEGSKKIRLIGVRTDGTVTVTNSDVIVDPAQADAADRAGRVGLGDRIAEGFGRTVTGIGILIALASIVGEALLLSGGAEKIVAWSRRAMGENRIALAFLLSGFILGIPVFFDTVFYLLVPLGKVMRVRTGRDYTLYILCIVAGATMTHSLVPPTPGPLFVAEALKVDLAKMILVGTVVAAVCATAGYAYAAWINRRLDIPLRETAGLKAADLEEIAKRDESSLPSLWLSLMPIFLPVVLISAAAFIDRPAADPSSGVMQAWNLLQTLGDKNISMAIAATIALLAVALRPRGKEGVAKSVGEALASAGVIILITSAGGAFGQMLQQTDIATAIKEMVPSGRLALLPLVFVVTMTIRIAQGSATVAMVTAAGIASPLAAMGDLGYHPVYLALAIGAGSKPGMWMNDSGFWIIGKMSGFTEGETLRTATVMMSVMGFTGLAVTWLGAWLFPMVG